jgi:hypothetical protein
MTSFINWGTYNSKAASGSDDVPYYDVIY